jgi:hypothetical protein
MRHDDKPRAIDQIRASKLPSNMMQFAARGALQVPPAENIEILVYLARHNKVFGDLARMTLAGWDEKRSLAAASDPQTSREVLEYLVSPDNLRPVLLPVLLENPSVTEGDLVKVATSAMRDTIVVMLQSARVCSMNRVIATLRANPYVTKEEVESLRKLKTAAAVPAAGETVEVAAGVEEADDGLAVSNTSDAPVSANEDEAVSSYLTVHAGEIAAEGNKPFQSIGGVVELLGEDYFPVTQTAEGPAPAEAASPADAAKPAVAAAAAPKKPAHLEAKRENALQKISHLDVKGRIQLALKGNKEERSLLVRDGTKVVALAVLEAPKLSDGEVEKFASQKNVLEAVLRQIPLKRRFMKNYIVVRNLVANPRTPLDLGLGLMKNLLIADLKNLSANKEVSETIRKLALKMYKQKLDAAAKK